MWAKESGGLNRKLREGDAKGVRMIAHSQKGAAATCPPKACGRFCFEMQEEEANDVRKASLLMPLVGEQFEILKVTLNEWGWCE
jgi:hypothetical protein